MATLFTFVICVFLKSEMGKTSKVVVCGQAAVGKTAILEQLINGDHVVGSVSQKLVPKTLARTPESR